MKAACLKDQLTAALHPSPHQEQQQQQPKRRKQKQAAPVQEVQEALNMDAPRQWIKNTHPADDSLPLRHGNQPRVPTPLRHGLRITPVSTHPQVDATGRERLRPLQHHYEYLLSIGQQKHETHRWVPSRSRQFQDYLEGKRLRPITTRVRRKSNSTEDSHWVARRGSEPGGVQQTNCGRTPRVSRRRGSAPETFGQSTTTILMRRSTNAEGRNHVGRSWVNGKEPGVRASSPAARASGFVTSKEKKAKEKEREAIVAIAWEARMERSWDMVYRSTLRNLQYRETLETANKLPDWHLQQMKVSKMLSILRGEREKHVWERYNIALD